MHSSVRGRALGVFAAAMWAVMGGVVAGARADTVVLVQDRSALGANDTVVWTNYGTYNPSLDYSYLASPSTITSPGGETLTVSNADNYTFRTSLQGSGQGEYNGNFAPGDSVLLNQNGGIITITFATPVYAVGANVEGYNSIFNPEITAYSSTGAVIGGTYYSQGYNEGGLDVDPFMGVVDESGPGIASVSFAVNAETEFAINQLSIGDAATTPLPNTSAAAAALLGFVAVSRVRRSKPAV